MYWSLVYGYIVVVCSILSVDGMYVYLLYSIYGNGLLGLLCVMKSNFYEDEEAAEGLAGMAAGGGEEDDE